MKHNNKKGFTIIEVVLVLAIAGLIFLMVFVALPALQRSQRDTARRNDLARVDTSLVQYQTNNQGTNDGSNLPFNSTTYRGGINFTATNTATINNQSLTVGGPCGNRPTGNTGGGNAMACIFLRDYMNTGVAGTDKTNEFQDPAGVYYGMDITKLYIAECYANCAPTMKRIHPRAQGRAYRILKRMSHITVVLDEKR